MAESRPVPVDPPTGLWWPHLVLSFAMDKALFLEGDGGLVENAPGTYDHHLRRLIPSCPRLKADDTPEHHHKAALDALKGKLPDVASDEEEDEEDYDDDEEDDDDEDDDGNDEQGGGFEAPEAGYDSIHVEAGGGSGFDDYFVPPEGPPVYGEPARKRPRDIGSSRPFEAPEGFVAGRLTNPMEFELMMLNARGQLRPTNVRKGVHTLCFDPEDTTYVARHEMER